MKTRRTICPRPGGTPENSRALKCPVANAGPGMEFRLQPVERQRFQADRNLPRSPGLPARCRRKAELRTRMHRYRRGAVLFEVLLALILFVAAAAVVTSAFNASTESLERQKLSAQALNLAASTIAEVQLGIRPGNSDSARPFEPPFDDWTWETALTPTETTDGGVTGLNRLEVIIRNQKTSTVQRLAQVVKLKAGATTNSVASPPQI